MEKEFIPYEQSLALKELGFEYVSTIFAYDEAGELYTRSGIPHDFNIRGLLSAPSFSQAFRWFREKYGYDVTIKKCTPSEYKFEIEQLFVEGNNYYFIDFSFNTYKEAELECLKKLIEIVKNK
jgi:hypothetical protein